MVGAGRHLSHDGGWRNQLARIYGGDPGGSRSGAGFRRVVPSRDQWKRTPDPPSDPHCSSRISHPRAPSRLFGSLEFKIKSRLWNPVARLAETTKAGVFSEYRRRQTLNRGTSADYLHALDEVSDVPLPRYLFLHP